MARIAGIESTAKSRSVVSTTSSTISNGVAYKPIPRTHKELAAFIILSHGHEFPEQAKYRILFWVDFRFFLTEELDAAVNQQRTKNVDNPVEPSNQAHP